MDFGKLMSGYNAAEANKLDAHEERARTKFVKKHGYPQGSNVSALSTLVVKAMTAEKMAQRAAYFVPEGVKNHKPSPHSLRLVRQARMDLAEKRSWFKKFLDAHPTHKPDFNTIQGNFFIGVTQFLKAELGAPDEKDAIGLLMMAKRMGVLIYPGQDIMGDQEPNEPQKSP